MSVWTGIALALLIYVAASINFAIVVLRLTGKGDPRQRFSGNPGAFNVYRQTSGGWAALVLLLDMGRAALAALLGLWLLPEWAAPLLAIPLLLGNRFPCFHGLRGGKGVANYLGFAAAFSPLAALLSMAVWVPLYKLTREAFIGSFGMLLVLALGIMIRCEWNGVAVSGTALSAGLVFYFHKPNIEGWLKRRRAGRDSG